MSESHDAPPPTSVPPAVSSAPPSTSAAPHARVAFPVDDAVRAEASGLLTDLAESLPLVTDVAERALISHEIAEIEERVRGDDLAAARGYLGAFNARPDFRPPLFGLIRLYTRRRSVTNLAKLLEALIKAAPTDTERADAIVYRGELFEDKLDDIAGAKGAYEEALLIDPGNRSAWLSLERVGLREGDSVLVRRAIHRIAELCNDPSRKARLLAELAADYARDATPESIEEATRLLHEAASLPVGRWRALMELERFAERHQRPQDVVFALENRATLAQHMAEGGDFQGGSGTFAISRLQNSDDARDTAASLWMRAARVRWAALEDSEGSNSAVDQALTLKPDDPRFRIFALQLADETGDSVRAAQHASWLLERDVGDASVKSSLHFRLAESAAAQGDTAGATEALRASLADVPDGPASLAAWIDQLVAAGDGGPASAELERLATTEATPSRRSGMYRAAAIVAIAVNGDIDTATRRLRSAAESDPADLASRRILALLLARAKGDEALTAWRGIVSELLEGAIDDDERVALLLDRHFAERYRSKDLGAAAATVEKIAALTAPDPWAAETAVLLHTAVGQFAAAAKWAGELAEKAPAETRREWAGAAARLYLAAGDDAKARSLALSGAKEFPNDTYLAALAFRLSIGAGERGAALDVLLRKSVGAGDAAAARWLVMGAVLLAQAGARDESRRALEAAVERSPESPSVRAALLATTRWRSDTVIRGQIADAALDAPDAGPEEAALGVELALAKIFLEHDVAAAATALDRAVARGGGDSLAASLMQAIVIGAQKGPDDVETVAALQAVLSALPSSDPMRGAIELELARALSSSSDTRDQALAVRELVDEEQPQAAAPRLLAMVDALQREDRRDVPSALGRLAEASDDSTAAVLRSASLATLRANARENDARTLAMTFPEMPASAITLSELTPSVDHAMAHADGLLERIGIAQRGDRPGLQRRAAIWCAVAGRHEDAITAVELLLKTNADDMVAWDILRVSGRRRERWDRVYAAAAALAERAHDPARAGSLWEEAAVVAFDHLNDPKRGEKCARRAIENDAARTVAYQRLRELLQQRKDFAGLEAVVTARIESVSDASELTGLYWEQSRMRRSLGRKEDALESAKHVVLLDPEHVAALAMCAEVHASAGRLAEAADALSRLATASETPKAQRRVARRGAIEIYHQRLGEPALAVEQLGKLVDEGHADDADVEMGFELASENGLWDAALQFAEVAADRAEDVEQRAATELRVALIQRDYLHDPAAALRAVRKAHDATPYNIEVLETLKGLGDPDENQRRARRTIESLRDLMRAMEDKLDVVVGIERAAHIAGDPALERAAQRLVRALTGEPGAKSVGLPSGRVSLRDPAIALRYRNPEDVGPAMTLIETAFSDLAEMAGVSTDACGVGRAERVKGSHPVRDALMPIVTTIGLSEFELYVGGNDDKRVMAIPGDPIALVLGRAVAPPFDDRRRFAIVRSLLLAARGLGALQNLTVDEAVACALATFAAAELPVTGGTAPFESRLRPVAKAISRRARKAVADQGRMLATSADPEVAVKRAIRAALSTSRRGALALSGSVPAALADVERHDPTNVARDGIQAFAVSDALVAVEREIGVDVGAPS